MDVKVKSVLADDIQLPECVPIDYVHAVLEGVFKSLMKTWFDSSNHRMPFYLGRDYQQEGKADLPSFRVYSYNLASRNTCILESFTFYRLVPELYPREMCKSNFHSLIHMNAFVKLWGPMWSYSMFGYESMNGFLKMTYHGTRQVLQHLVFTTMLKQQLRFRLLMSTGVNTYVVTTHMHLGKLRPISSHWMTKKLYVSYPRHVI